MDASPTTQLLPDSFTLTDAGIETVLIFEHGLDLPAFATFPLLEHDEGRNHLTSYYSDFLRLASELDAGLILETATWRANPDWGAQLGYSADDLRRVAHDAVAFNGEIRTTFSGSGTALISGCIGPRGDGYVPGEQMSSTEAADYHSTQINDLADAGADLVTSFTLSYVAEGAGMAAAAGARGIPAVVGFTVETDGRLPSGTPLREAIEEVDDATGGSVAWYMVNCAHPEHIAAGLGGSVGSWAERVGAVRGNASRMSHAELDESEQLDSGDPNDFADGYAALRKPFPNLRVAGGCCGTDISHVEAVARSW
jgi:homocysteine S-methyltransferase